MSFSTRVIGIGNPLRGDDGVGVALVARLREAGVPDGVDLLDGGLGGLALLDDFEDVARVILVDAADFGGAPGDVAVIDLAASPIEENPSMSLHEGLTALVPLLQSLGSCPELLLVAVQPRCLEVTTDLSADLAAALPRIERTVRSLFP